MQSVRSLIFVAGLAFSAGALMLMGCEKEPSSASPPSASRSESGTDDHEHAPDDGHDHGTASSSRGAARQNDHDHAPGDDHDHEHEHAPGDGHDHDHGDGHGHGPTTDLGSQSAGEFVVKASRDGDVTAGGEASVDISVTGGSVKPAAVRLWIGAEDGKGSMKAKAETEKDGWHAHVEVPNPMPGNSKLWIEIETEKGEKIVTGFELKM